MHVVHTRVALFGAAGYSGVELLKLLAGHPAVELVAAASDRHAGTPVAGMTGMAGERMFVTTAQALETQADVALLAVPPEPAVELTAKLRARGTRVVDLSNAHRGAEGAVYGLVSLNASEVAGAAVVANPGCYATCVITALAPFAKAGAIERVSVAAGSGVTGAGKTADEAMSLGELHDNVRAYKVLRHQHVPEIERALGMKITLTTHLLPIARGIFATITGYLREPADGAALRDLLRSFYAGDPTVTVAGTPEDVSLRKVVGTNQCMVGVAEADGVVVITAALDNLLKGAAGQAIENMNLMIGQPRMAGLGHLARHA